MKADHEILEALRSSPMSYKDLAQAVKGSDSKSAYKSLQRTCARLEQEGLVELLKSDTSVQVKLVVKTVEDMLEKFRHDFEKDFDETRPIGWRWKWASHWIMGDGRTLEPNRIKPPDSLSTNECIHEIRDVAQNHPSRIFHNVPGFKGSISAGHLVALSYEQPHPPDSFRLGIRQVLAEMRNVQGTIAYISPSCIVIENSQVKLTPHVGNKIMGGKYPWHPGIQPVAKLRRLIEGKAPEPVGGDTELSLLASARLGVKATSRELTAEDWAR